MLIGSEITCLKDTLLICMTILCYFSCPSAHTVQCHFGILPLGTGNDLARVLGWGSSIGDNQHIPSYLEQMEQARVRLLDRYVCMSWPCRH